MLIAKKLALDIKRRDAQKRMADLRQRRQEDAKNRARERLLSTKMMPEVEEEFKRALQGIKKVAKNDEKEIDYGRILDDDDSDEENEYTRLFMKNLTEKLEANGFKVEATSTHREGYFSDGEIMCGYTRLGLIIKW